MWFMFCPSRPMVFKKSVTPALAVMVLKMPASEKKLRTSSRVTNCGTAMVMMNNVRQSFWLGLFVVDEHGQKYAAEEVGEGGKEGPHQRPAEHPAKGVAEGQAQRLPAKQRSKVSQPHPCKQGGGRHMLLIVVGKGNSDQNEQRDDGEHHHTQHRKGEQGNVELFVQVDVDVL